MTGAVRWTSPGTGRVRRRARVQPHRATTAALQAAYPFFAEGGLGARGSYIGRDLFGGAFCFDPFELYAAGLLTNPNMLIAGAVGSGKSSLVKTFLWRQQEFGRAAWVADPKGEYADLAAAGDAPVIRLGPGQPARLNPLDVLPRLDAVSTDADRVGDTAAVDPAVGPAEVTAQRLRLVLALAGTALARPPRPVEQAACGLALTVVTEADDHAAPPVLPVLVNALLDPSERAAATLRMSAGQLTEASRDVALTLHRLCAGDLAGMFDGPTSVAIDPGSPLVVLDLSEVYRHHREALPLVMTCATAWLQAAIARADAARRYVVVDEAWALLANVSTARWLQQSYKLARAHGVANIAVLHRFSDLTAAGAAGSETVSLAHGLLADAGTRVVYGQPHSELADTQAVLGLTETEVGLLPHLPQGTGLWKIGPRSFVVEHRRSDAEIAMTDTDQKMTGRPR